VGTSSGCTGLSESLVCRQVCTGPPLRVRALRWGQPDLVVAPERFAQMPGRDLCVGALLRQGKREGDDAAEQQGRVLT